MVNVFNYVKRLALTFWLGEMLFFAFIFAPKVFTILPRPEAANLQAHIFPGYFAVGVICALLILICSMLSQMVSGTGFFSKSERLSYRHDRLRVLPLILTVLGGCIFAFCLVVLTPKITEIQSSLYSSAIVDPDVQQRFQVLHHTSTILNGIVLLMLLVLTAVL